MEAPPTAVATPQNSPSSAPTPEPSAAPDAFVETFEWYQDADGYRRAREDSTASGRPMVVYVYTDWCPYCREFEREILDTLVVKTYLRAFPKVKVNPEANRASEQVKDALGVDGFPTFLVLNPATRGIARVSRMAGDRLKTPQEFVDACQRMAGSGS
jgi:thiol-disulfide isomerase/thioredoxin